MAKNRVAGTMSFEVDNTGGTLINISAFVDGVSPVGDVITWIDVTQFTDTSERIIAGIRPAQEFTIRGFFDDAANADPLLAPLIGTIGTVRFGPEGTSSGSRRLQAEALAIFYNPAGEVKGAARYEMGFKLDGSMTVGTF